MRTILNCIDSESPKADTMVLIYQVGIMQLSEMKIGQRGRIVGLNQGEKVYRQRLISMGVIPGAEFTVSRIAPLGDPVEITIRGFALSLRVGEASILQIERVEA